MNKQAQQLVLHWANNYPNFAEDCIRFRGKDGQIFRHATPHPGQVKLRQIDLHKKAIHQVLKARQVGCTSEIASQLSHLALFTPGSSILVLAQTNDGVKGINRLYATIFDNLPKVLRQGIFKAKIAAQSIVLANESRIDFLTANSESGRGVARQAVHMTECAFFEDLEATLTGIRPTCHGPLIMESTANGPGTYHELWNDNAIQHHFISWRDDALCRSTQPVKPKPTAQELDYVDKHGLSDDEARWYIQTLRSSNWTAMKQEAPTTQDEAFILGGSRFFKPGYFPGDTSKVPDIQIHHQPKRGNRYAVGVDCASGSPNGDRSTAVVLDVTDPNNIITAASIAERKAPTAFASDVYDLAKKFYNATICVERNAGYGLTVLDTLRQKGASLYARKVFDQTTKFYTQRYGWDTTQNTRPILLSALQDAVDNGRYVPKDPRIEEEFNAFRYNNDGKPEAVVGAHDDLVFAAALAIQAMSQSRDTTQHKPDLPPPSQSDGIRAQLEWELKTGTVIDIPDTDEED